MKPILIASAVLAMLAFSLSAHAQCVHSLGTIDNHSVVNIDDPCSIELNGKIDNHSRVNIKSAGYIHIQNKDDAKIDNASVVTLDAGQDVRIAGRIDGESQVTLRAKGPIAVGDKIDNGKTRVSWCGPSFPPPPNGINGGAQVRKIQPCPW